MNILKTAIIQFLFLTLCLSCQKTEKAAENTPDKPVATSRTYCFQKLTQNGGITDSLYVHLSIADDSVTGVWNWLPAEKDKMTGTLQGTIHDNVVKAIYTYHAEGQIAKEEKIFKVDGDTLRVKNGALEERDGVWVLRDAGAAVYTETIPRIDCLP